MKIICPTAECTGCTACSSICPHSAITFREDERGFLYPVINEILCVDCGLCHKVCPNNTKVSRSIKQEAYIAVAKSLEEQRTSTSGGLASVLARHVIRQGGVVYGCSGQECSDVHHVRVQLEEEIDSVKGSKYVQSDLGICFKEIKNDLQKGIQVLFVGTPCQCAGLRSFLMKDYEKLFIVDFVCHGVPSQRILSDAIRNNLKQDDLQGMEVSFRYREGASEHSVYGMQLKQGGKIAYQCNWPQNDYITGFLRGVFYRESCYACKYASSDRISDITLGDFWDRKKEKKISHKAIGLSSVICNSEKGIELFYAIQHQINAESIPIESLVQGNGQLKKSFAKPKSFGLFSDYYVEKGYEMAYRNVIRIEMKKTKRALFIGRIIGFIKRFVPDLK